MFEAFVIIESLGCPQCEKLDLRIIPLQKILKAKEFVGLGGFS